MPTKKETSVSTHASSISQSTSGSIRKQSVRKQKTKINVISSNAVLASEEKSEYRLYDENKVDVTPLPLTGPVQVAPKPQKPMTNSSQSFSRSSVSRRKQSVVAPVQKPIQITSDFFSALESQTLGSNFAVSSNPASKASYSSMMESRQQRSIMSTDDASSMESVCSEEDYLPKMEYKRKSPVSLELSEAELNRPVHIQFTESDTIQIFELPCLLVNPEDPESATVSQSNQRYSEILHNHSSDNNSAERQTQTFNSALKCKDVQTVPLKPSSQTIQTYEWIIYDAMQAVVEHETTDIKEEITEFEVAETEGSMASVASQEESVGSKSTHETYSSKNELVQKKENEVVLNQKSVLESLRIMESAILESIYASELLDYRTIDKVEEDVFNLDSFELKVPSLQHLWSFSFDQSRERRVNCLSWNKQNMDMLAVGYSKSSKSQGMVCLWSLKNIERPSKIFHCSSSVTALDFSKSNPALLAVGFADGRIAVYDVRKQDVIVESTTLAEKHRDCVYQIKWVDKEQSLTQTTACEVIVSISTDGRVCQWSLHKGFQSLDLMTLKMSKQSQPESKNKSLFISRSAGGLSFDFNPSDANVYLVATEDGGIHKCSVSYNEQYLCSYYSHSAPVNKIKWSPFHHDIFASCSADWSLNVWHQDKDVPILRFQRGKDSIVDLDWSPFSPFVLVSVSYEGIIEIWDLQSSALDPVVCHSMLSHLTCTLFAHNLPILATGDENGAVSIHRVRRMNWPCLYGMTKAESKKKLNSLLSSLSRKVI